MSRSRARSCGWEALRGFSWSEYAPFAILVAFDLALLGLALNLATPWGMATVGFAAERLAGPGASHFPGFFAQLPSLLTGFDAIVYAVVGSVVLPFAAARIAARIGSEPKQQVLARAPGAVPSTAVAFLLALAAYFLIDAATGRLLGSGAQARGSGPATMIALAGSNLLTYAVFAITLHVPITAVRTAEFAGGLRPLRAGLAFGVRRLPVTLVYVIAFSVPAIAVQLFLGAARGVIFAKLRPEMVASVLAIAALLSNVGAYLIYGAATRLQAAAAQEEQE